MSLCYLCCKLPSQILEVRWLEFLQTIGVLHEYKHIFLCEQCKLSLMKVEKFIRLLKISLGEETVIQNCYVDIPYRLTVIKLQPIDISPSFSEVFVNNEDVLENEDAVDNNVDTCNDVNDIVDNMDSSGDCKAENVGEKNALNMNFEVTYLTLEEQKSEILFKKKSVKFKNMLYKCDKCGIGFVSHDAYKDHNLRHNNDTAIHVCPVCHLHFKSQLVLSQHKLSHKRRFRCLLCGSSFKRWAHALGHRAVCGSDPVTTACEVCQKIFDNEYSLEIHKKIHMNSQKYVCDECSKSFRTKQHLIIHLRTHTGVKPFKCSQCDKSFSTNSNLKAHIVVHSDDKKFYCVECDKNFKSDKSLKRHFASSAKHVDGKMYSCPSCVKLFTSVESLNAHRRSVHMSSYCEICEKLFASSSNLRKHLKNVHVKR